VHKLKPMSKTPPSPSADQLVYHTTVITPLPSRIWNTKGIHLLTHSLNRDEHRVIELELFPIVRKLEFESQSDVRSDQRSSRQ